MDNLITAISENGGIVVYALDSTGIVAEAERIHQTSATASAALGRLLTAAALMAVTLKDEDTTLTLKVKGGGPAGALTAICDANGNLRGNLDFPQADLDLNPATKKLDVGGLVGKEGQLTVIRDSGSGEPYTGQVDLVSGEIAEDITAYYARSEQIPTVCALGVLVNPDLTIRSAGGFLLQLMPGASDEEVALIERNIADLDPVTKMIDSGLSPQDIAFQVMAGFSPQLLDSASAQYRCNCSRDKMIRILSTLGKKELETLAEEAPETEIVCSYCDQKYLFSSGDLLALVPNES